MDLSNLDWHELLEKLKTFATSETARAKLEKIQALVSPEECQESFKNIFSAQALIDQNLRPFFKSLDLYPQWISRLKKNATLKILEIRDVREFSIEAMALREACRDLDSPWAKQIVSEVEQLDEVVSLIDHMISPGGEIRSDASETLFNLFREKEKLQRDVQNTLDRLVKDHDMENLLQDRYVTNREGRWVLPVKGGMQRYMPGVIHAASQSKQTVFIEPEKVIPMNNRLRQVENEIEEEIERLLVEISKNLFYRVPQFIQAEDRMVKTDIELAQAQLSSLIESSAVEFTDELELFQLRHPLLQSHLQSQKGKRIISNNIDLEKNKSILLLSGPNAGGKTVLLKSIGLAAQMARCGIPPAVAANSKIPFFKEILVIVGDSQSVEQELSTFAAHLKLLQQGLLLSGPQNLILVDEICGSTDPEEGAALARCFIEEYAKKNVYGVITSHLHPLKIGWKESDSIFCGSMECNPKTGSPTYQFLPGVSGESMAIKTAERIGISKDLINRAVDYLSPQSRLRIENQVELDSMKAQLIKLQDQLHEEIKTVNADKLQLKKTLEQAEKERSQAYDKTIKNAEKKVEEALQNARVANVLERHREVQKIQMDLPQIVKSSTANTLQSEKNNEKLSAENFGARFSAGTKVFIQSLGQDGVIQSEPNNKGEVQVLSQSLRLWVSWKDLKTATDLQNPTLKLLRQSGNFQTTLTNEDPVIDLRGKTVEEALGKLETALEHGSQHMETRIKVIHGHGTEALKKAVRNYLSRSVLVKKWNVAPPAGGGDGVTWIELNDED